MGGLGPQRLLSKRSVHVGPFEHDMGLGWIRGGFVVYVFPDTKGWAELWSSPSIISSNLWPPVHGAGAGDGRAGGVHGPRPGLCQPKRPVCLPSHRRKPEMWIGGLFIFSGVCSCYSLCRGKKYHSILRDRKTCFSLYSTFFCSSDLGTFSTHFLLIFIFARAKSIFCNCKIKMQRELYFCEALLGYGINIIIFRGSYSQNSWFPIIFIFCFEPNCLLNWMFQGFMVFSLRAQMKNTGPRCVICFSFQQLCCMK